MIERVFVFMFYLYFQRVCGGKWDILVEENRDSKIQNYIA